MNNNLSQQSIKDQVLAAVTGGAVKMRPRWYFVLRTALFTLASIGMLCVVLALISFIVFSLQQEGVWFMPALGLRGFTMLLTALPWVLIATSVLFIGILGAFMKRYSFIYRRPLVISAGGVVLVTIVGGLVIAHTSLHRSLFRYAKEQDVPFSRELYHQFAPARLPEVHRGFVTDVTSSSFVLNDLRDGTITVIVTPETRGGDGEFVSGQAVVVFGDQLTTSTVNAYGIRRVSTW